jgi:hypothetical protein
VDVTVIGRDNTNSYNGNICSIDGSICKYPFRVRLTLALTWRRVVGAPQTTEIAIVRGSLSHDGCSWLCSGVDKCRLQSNPVFIIYVRPHV